MHTRRGHYTPCLVDGHELLITRVTHPLVTLHEKIATLPVSVRVKGVTHEPQQRARGHKTVHTLGLNDLNQMVTVKKFFHHQPMRAPLDMAPYKTCTPRKTLQATVKGAQGESKPCFQHLPIGSDTFDTLIIDKGVCGRVFDTSP